MTSTMDLADMFAAADSAEHHLCLFGMRDDFKEAIADKQKARVALEQRIKEIEADAKRWKKVSMQRSDYHGDCYVMVFAGDGDYPPMPSELDSIVDAMKEQKVDRAMSEAALTKAVEISQEYKLP